MEYCNTFYQLFMQQRSVQYAVFWEEGQVYGLALTGFTPLPEQSKSISSVTVFSVPPRSLLNCKMNVTL